MVGIATKILPSGPNEAEVTLIGGTSGYGESVVVRYGENEWAIIDSCIDSLSQKCLPIAYLEDIGVDVGTQVKYEVCTHWHDDHIKGLHKVLEACSSETTFCVAIASEKLSFLYEIQRSNLYEPDRGVRKELILAMDIVKDKGIRVKRLIQDLPVFRTASCECIALSPSQKEVDSFYNELAYATSEQGQVLTQKEILKTIPVAEIEAADDITDVVFTSLEETFDVDSAEITEVYLQELGRIKEESKFSKPNINDRSVALLFTICGHHAVLGADLEVSSDRESGWQSVNDCMSMEGVVAGIFKIPHHGSSTGYYELFLRNHIKPTATGKVSTWLKGKKVLPEKVILNNYREYLNGLFITTDPSYLTGKFSSPEYKKVMEETTESIVDIKNQYGIIQSRLDLTSGSDDWTTKLYGSAKVVNQTLIDRMD